MAQNEFILLADDDDNDVLLLQRAFKKAGLRDWLRVVTDGEQAINYLSGRGEYFRMVVRQMAAHDHQGAELLE